MTDYTKRKTKSLSSMPLWLESAIQQYHEQNDHVQSWSHALMDLALRHLLGAERDFDIDEIVFGSREFEAEVYKNFDEYADDLAESEPDKTVYSHDYWLDVVLPPKPHGGNRKKYLLMKCSTCGKKQNVLSSDTECRNCHNIGFEELS